jgi:dihydrofolate synthase / folylpolyglutamate synthase
MHIQAIKTHPIAASENLENILDTYITHLSEGSIVAVTSKIVALCEGRVCPIEWTDKAELIRSEADEVLDVPNPYGVTLTIKDDILAASAGIDESNACGQYVLWPADPYTSAQMICTYLRRRFQLHHVGVILTDSVTRPMRWGVTGISIAHSGFEALYDYRGKPDIFGRYLHFTQSNLADGLAAATVFVMGEGDECTPIAIVSDLPMMTFTDTDMSPEAIKKIHISREEDIYGVLLENPNWKQQ